MSGRRIRVLVVDDSALVRKVLTESLARFPDIEVVGTALDPYIARDKILSLEPDVLTLDIEMPRMDGITFLKLLMKNRPMPVIILSSLTTEGSAKAMEALQSGAVDVMAKPGGSYSADADGTRLAERIRAAAAARLRRIEVPAGYGRTAERGRAQAESNTAFRRRTEASGVAAPEAAGGFSKAGTISTVVAEAARLQPSVVPRPTGPKRLYGSRSLILMGASTGGTEALKVVLTGLRSDLPGICVVQHIPERFSLAFANRLNELCELEVREAKSGDVVHPGLVLVAPGGHHLTVRWAGAHYVAELNDGMPVHHQRPAVDVLFESAVKAGGASQVLALLLTGMGSDGAAGMLKLREQGAVTAAQNEETCVVFGMPREAIRLGAAQKVVSLWQMSTFVERYGSEVALR